MGDCMSLLIFIPSMWGCWEDEIIQGCICLHYPSLWPLIFVLGFPNEIFIENCIMAGRYSMYLAGERRRYIHIADHSPVCTGYLGLPLLAGRQAGRKWLVYTRKVKINNSAMEVIIRFVCDILWFNFIWWTLNHYTSIRDEPSNCVVHSLWGF